MANKRIEMLDIKHLLRLKLSGKSNRLIGQLLGHSRNTINSYVQQLSELEIPYSELYEKSDEELAVLLNLDREKEVDRYAILSSEFPKISSELKKVGVTYQVLWNGYKAAHPGGYCYTQYKTHVQAYLNRQSVGMRLSHKYGDKLYIDFTGKKLPIIDKVSGEMVWQEVFVAVLGGSQYTYVEAVNSQKAGDFLEATQNALWYLGGVPQSIVPDNLKSAVTKSDKYEPELNRNYKSLGLHYGTTILPTRAYKPQDKALVEGAVKIIYQRIFYPLNELKFYNLRDLNAAIHSKLAIHNNLPFSDREYSRQALFDRHERQLLGALPVERYELYHYQESRVRKDGYVYLQGHYYSVPYPHIGKRVYIKYTDKSVEIYKHNHERLALHKRSNEKGGVSSIEAHLASNVRFVRNWSVEQFEKQAAEIGVHTQAYFRQLYVHKAHPEQAAKACMGIMNLSKYYASERIEKACQRAAYFNNYAYKSIKTILEKGLDQINWEADNHTDDTPNIEAGHPNIRGGEYYK